VKGNTNAIGKFDFQSKIEFFNAKTGGNLFQNDIGKRNWVKEKLRKWRFILYKYLKK